MPANELAKTLPFILGAAISPVLFVTTLLILAQPKKPVYKTLAFLVGSMLTILMISLIVFYTATLRPTSPGGSDTFAHIVIGLVLIVLALDIYKRGPAKGRTSKIKDHGVWPYIVLGVALMLTNFTTIAMVFAVAVETRGDHTDGIVKIVYMLTTVLASLLPIILPLLILVLAGKRSKVVLSTLSVFMKQYAHIITALFFALLGLFSLLKVFY